MKFIDYFALRLTVFLISFTIASLYIDSLWLSLGSAAAVTLLLSLILDKIIGGRNMRGYNDYQHHLLLSGSQEVFKDVAKALGISGEITDNRMVCGDKIIFNAVKFGNVTADEIVRYYNTAKSIGARELYLLARSLQRNAAVVLNDLDIRSYFIPLKSLYRLLRPEKTETPRVKKHRLKEAFRYAFSHTNGKYYLFTALILGITSVFIPFKTYYLVLSAVTLLFAVVSFSPLGEDALTNRRGIFSKEFISQNKKDDKDNL